MAARIWRCRPAPVITVALVALVMASRTAPDVEAGREELLAGVVRLAEIAGREVLTDDHCLFSTAGVAMSIGRDPEALAEFVRSEIGYEPRLGVLQGAEGTLAAGRGGDWDRAVLLQSLLAEAGYAATFRVSTRPEAGRAAVVDLFLSQPRVALDLPASGSSPLGDAAARAGLELHNRELHASERAARWRRLRGEAYDAASACVPLLEKALESAGSPAQRSFDARRRELMAAAAERVAIVLGDGTVLDPGPDAAPAGDGEPVEAVPTDRSATLTLTLRMDVEGQGAPTGPVELMQRTFPVAELLGKPVRFQVAPDGSEAGDAPPNEWGEDEWHTFLAGVKRFQAILEVDRLWMASEAFDRYGRTFKVSGDGRVQAASDVGGAVGRGLGGLTGGGNRREEEPKTRIAALVLHLDLALPGQGVVSTQRYLWGDLRPDVSPVYHTDLLVFGGPVGPFHSLWQGLSALSSNAAVLQRLMTSDDRYRLTKADDLRVVSQMPQEWQLARLDIAEGLVAGDEGLTILGGPAVVMQSTFLLPDAPGPGVGRRVVIDVVHDGLRVVPRTAGAAEAAVRANLLVGAASTVFESLAVRERIPAALISGAYAEFERAAAAGERATCVTLPEIGGLAPAPLTRWALERAPEGTVCLFPSPSRTSSWWAIDRATGAVVGRGDDGAGQSAAEYQAALKTAMKNLKCGLQSLGGMMAGKSAADQSYDFFSCFSGVDPKDPSSWAQTGTGMYTGYIGTRHFAGHWAESGANSWAQVADMWSMLADGLVGVAKLEDSQKKR